MSVLSRALILASIANLCPILSFAHQSTRRSLNFRPRLKTDFSTTPLPILDSRDPYEVAHGFLNKLSYPRWSYIIRKDSYTDESTGISHVYARQVIDGLEVADGNINLNIRDGQVLSYGNSFFEGSAKSSLLSAPNWHQAIYCSEVTTWPGDPACGSTLSRLQALASLHSSEIFNYYRDPRAATFFLLQAADPAAISTPYALTSLEAEIHECTDPLEEEISCKGWLITGLPSGLGPVRARQVYVQTPGLDGSTSLNLAWRLEVSLPDNHYEAYVSVLDPSKIISVVDWISDAPIPDSNGFLSALERYIFAQIQEALPALDSTLFKSKFDLLPGSHTAAPTSGSYRVWKWGINDPESGKRTLEVAPKDRRASPLGWHSVPAGNDPLESRPDLDKNAIVNYTTTVGNNVIAQENWAGGEQWKTYGRPDGGPNLVFDFPYGADPSEPGWEKVEPRQYRNLSIAQLFYVANMFHDLLYLYGFDEVSGNFQQHNFGKGGAEGDGVIMYAQDGRGFNNAFFESPPDGQHGRCRMHIWDTAKPYRDGGFDVGILIHELSHGLSSRLTGGPRNAACLNAFEAGGMGEGWGDFIATTVRSTRIYKDYPIGAWAANAASGTRPFMYSLASSSNEQPCSICANTAEQNITTNPSLYDFLQDFDYREVHNMGEIWAEILYVVSNQLITKHGFSDSLFPSSDSGSDFYRLITHASGVLAKIPKHGNTLMLRLVVAGMKMQPCNPTFIQARDAIIAADKALTGGENKCTLWKAFASRGLGTNAKNYTFSAKTSINGFEIPSGCK